MDDGNITAFVLLLGVVAGAMTVCGQSLDVCATCHTNATCEDKDDGSGKVCNCKYGFVGNGRTFCQDKDECQIGASNICGQHTTCHNTYGSFYCTCHDGYSPSNSMSTFIPNDGTHCTDIDECRVAGLCGEGGSCRNLEGSVECSCEVGYRVQNGAEPFHPRRDRAACKEVDCGRPVPVEDTVLLSVTGTTYGSEATYACDQGFVWRSGDNSSVCGADGRWKGPTLACEEVDCGPPPALPHAQMLWNESSKMGAEVVYQCNPGYHNVGKGNVSTCSAAGQWERPPLLCQETLCGRPRKIETTEQVWDGNSSPGSTVLYICKEGLYNRGTSNVSVCNTNGQWTVPALSCQEILCGDPPALPHTGQVWNGSSSPGSTVTYYCKIGFSHSEGDNVSLCTRNGSWTRPSMSCQEVHCGAPRPVPHAVMLWDAGSAFGSRVVYGCEPGYRSVGRGNVSVCTASGEWEEALLQCEEITCSEPVFKPHAKMLWDGTSHIGSVVYYQCDEGYRTRSPQNHSVCGENGQWEDVDLWCEAKCGPAPFLAHAEVVWHNTSVVIHRCADGFHSWRGSGVSVCGGAGAWHRATLRCIERKPPINHLFVQNQKCLHWRAEKYEEDTEVYKVVFTGSRDFQRSFHDQRKQFLSSKAEQLDLCLNLLPVTNYSIFITAVTAKFTASTTANTSLTVPPAPLVYYREFETLAPTLSLRRSVSTLDPISLYQVLVLPAEGIVVFDCSSSGSSDPSVQNTRSSEYVAAQIHVRHVGTQMNFTVGDRLHYGGFFNAPLEHGRDYYIILRAVSQWKTALKSVCVMWAKVKGTSSSLRVSLLSAAASVVVVAMVILGGYIFTRYGGYKAQHIIHLIMCETISFNYMDWFISYQ
ncbi:sushi domain-containing protein 1 isoform X2 [Betta splendens]|uniref:Sushi domain-containing protein 1 isoform X2 n=1 Tax=Betta splendens TaxID=158456 RepID=A0A6P7NJQ7_BETSP|nr:sushi domain-containing protein 1 isoform X2 [Betta splendens]